MGIGFWRRRAHPPGGGKGSAAEDHRRRYRPWVPKPAPTNEGPPRSVGHHASWPGRAGKGKESRVALGSLGGPGTGRSNGTRRATTWTGASADCRAMTPRESNVEALRSAPAIAATRGSDAATSTTTPASSSGPGVPCPATRPLLSFVEDVHVATSAEASRPNLEGLRSTGSNDPAQPRSLGEEGAWLSVRVDKPTSVASW